MKTFIHALLPFLVAAVLIAGCSRPAGPESPPSAPAEGTGAVAQPAISAPAEKTAAENATEQEQKVAPAPKAPAKKQAKPAPSTSAAQTMPPAAPAPAATPTETVPPAQVEARPAARDTARPVARTRQVTIPAGTLIPVRMIDSVDSRTDKAGQTFHASIDSDVVADNEIVIRKGEDAYLELVASSSAGEFRGKSELQLQLERVVVADKSYTIETNVVEHVAASEGRKTARDIGIGAAIGAAIGAITGGKKGAAIGAGAGAGAGVAVAAITKGEQVLVPSETRLEFRLERPVRIELQGSPVKPPVEEGP